MNHQLRRVLKIGKWIMLCYAIGGIGLYHLQENIIFQPEKISKDSPIRLQFPIDDEMNINLPLEEWSVPMSIQDTIHGFSITANSKSKAVLLYFPDSKGNAAIDSLLLGKWHQLGYEVWAMDYPGFGKSVGRREEYYFYKYADQFLKLATQGKNKDSVFIYGKGLGSALAAYTASYFTPRGLMLETPFYSLSSLFHQYACIYPVSKMSAYQFPEYQWLQEVKCPILMISRYGDGCALKTEFKKLKTSLEGKGQIKTWQQDADLELYKDKEFLKGLDEFLP